jgi:hypothetical protein
VQLAAKGGTINLSISFIDIPADGTFNVMLQGTDSSNSIALQGLKISDYQGGFNVNGLSYPSNFNTSLQVEWFKGPTNPPITAQVIVFLTIDSSPLLFDECNKLGIITDNIAVELIQANFALPHQKDMVFKPTPVVRAGQQTWSLLYGVNPPSGKKGGLVHG